MLTIEQRFLDRNAATLQIEEAKALIKEINLLKRKGLEKSLQLGNIVAKGKAWFKSAEGKAERKKDGIDWSMDDFLLNAYGIKKSWASRIVNAAGIDSKTVGEFKRQCTTAKNNGEAVSESIEELIKFAKSKDGKVNTKGERLGGIAFYKVDGKVELVASGKGELDDLVALANRFLAGADTSELLAKLESTAKQ